MRMVGFAHIVIAGFLLGGARFVTSETMSSIFAGLGVACAYFGGYFDAKDEEPAP